MTKRTPWDYIVPVKLPRDLQGVEPGKLPANLLKAVPGGGKLHHLAADSWIAMVSAAKADGVELKPTSSGDTYRDYELQKRGFLTRYQLEPIPGQSTKTFEGKTWYLKKGMAMLATPGKSQHNLGLAVDVHSASEPKRINWLIANVEKFGWSWEVVPSEPWHIRYVAGDNVPQSVKDFHGGAVQSAPAPTPKPVASATPASSDPHLTIGNKGQSVRKAQRLLAKHGFGTNPDGDFGPKTQANVKDFQKAKNISVTGNVDAQTWAALLT
jgi:hypothetical protein